MSKDRQAVDTKKQQLEKKIKRYRKRFKKISTR